jgi:hypothetical protein
LRRRDFIFTSATAVLNAQTAPRPHVKSIDIISRQPEFYHGWPTLALRRNAQLVVTYSGGRDAHVCPFGRVELIRSRDGGKTWSWPEVLLDSPIDDRDSGVLETPSGSLLVTTFTSLAYEAVLKQASGWPAEKLERWRAVNLRTTPQQRHDLLDTWMLRSTDGGMTWSAPYRVPVNSPHGPIALAGGRLIYAGKQLWQPGQKVGVCESSDDGKTWRWLSEIPARPGDTVVQYHELHAVEAANGRIIGAHPQSQPPEPGRDPADGIPRRRPDLDRPAPDRRLGSAFPSASPAGRPLAHVVWIPSRALRQPCANQLRPWRYVV